MKILSNVFKRSHKVASEEQSHRDGTLYSICRRLEKELNEQRAQLSTIRRDLNRIDKKVYREEGKALPWYSGNVLKERANEPLENPYLEGIEWSQQSR